MDARVMRGFATAIWLIALLLSAGAAAIFVQGVVRDTRPGEPVVGLDLASASDWRVAPFRVRRSGRFTLYLSTVNHAPPFGAPFGGAIEVRLREPSGRELLRREYDSLSRHVRPDNMHWTELASLELEGGGGEWSLAARTLSPDEGFRGTRSEVTLRRVRADPGMGGLINYVMIIPAFGFGLLALLPAFLLSRKGWRWALWISGAWVLLLMLLLSGRLVA